MKPRQSILLAGLIGGAALTSGIALTATSGWLIVRASERPVILTLLCAIVAVRAFGMARPWLRQHERLLSHDAALGDLAARRTRVFADLIPLTPARLGRRSRSRVLTGVVDDLTDVVESQVRVTVPVITALVSGVAAVALTAVLWPPVGLILSALLLLVALSAVLAARLEERSLPDLLSAREQVQRVSDLATRQGDELRAIGAQHRVSEWLDEAHQQWDDAVRRQSYGRALVAATILFGTALATVAAAWVALDAQVSPAIKALLVVVPVALADALAPVADALRARARARGSERRLTALLAQQPAVAATGSAPVATAAPTLTLQGITASWTGEESHLGPLDLTVNPGAQVAIVGANGSGKSTLLAVLARHLDPLSGTYSINGIDVLDADLADTRSLFAVVDDEPHVFASTVRANLTLARPDADDDELIAALTGAGLRDWFDGIPKGLDTLLGAGGRGLSGGERARLSLARALLSRRPVLLLDEPVAHLDHPTAVAVLADIARAAAGRTIIMVSHRPEGLELFDEIIDLTPAHPALSAR